MNNQNDFSEILFINFNDYTKAKGLNFRTHLDLACGTGTFCINMQKKGINSSGSDISEGMINQAKINAEKENLDINFFVGNMATDIFSDKYDLITCNYDSINHLENFEAWIQTFKNVHQMLNGDGYFLFDFNTFINFERLISMPEEHKKTENYEFWRIMNKLDNNHLEFVFRYSFSDGTTEEQKIKECFYETETVIKALEEIGFEIVDILGKKFVRSDDLGKEQKLHILCKKK